MDILTRTAKLFYEEQKLQESNQLYKALFPTEDNSTSSSFMLDKLTDTPYAVGYREKDMQSNLRAYQPGTGMQFEIPRASEKTPITEALLDAVAVGLESTDGFGQNEAQIIGQIVRQHVAAHNMTKNAQALQVLGEGKFEARGAGDLDLGLDIDFSRDSSLDLTYDFTANGASFIEAIANGQEELIAKGTSLEGMAVMLGQNWLSAFSADSGAQTLAAQNPVNQTLTTPMMPPMFMGTHGLFVVGQLRGKGMLAPVWLTSYNPGVPFKSSPSASATPWVGVNTANFFSTMDTRYQVNRGVVALDNNEKATTVVGDLVFDSYTQKDPVNTFLRSQTRHCFVPAETNHTAQSTGTFA